MPTWKFSVKLKVLQKIAGAALTGKAKVLQLFLPLAGGIHAVLNFALMVSNKMRPLQSE